jgi:hypothetical protein
MKTMLVAPKAGFLAVCSVAAALALPAAAQTRGALAVFARQTGPLVAGHAGVPTEIYTVDAHGVARELTHDGLRKQLPVISPDGSRIAYILPDVTDATAHLVVIDLAGRELGNFAIEPNRDDVATLGHMSGIDRVEWLGDGSRIAIRLWINPSQAHFYVLDLASGAPAADFVDDNGYAARDTAAAFSHDGAHFAYVTGLPHFGGLQDGEAPGAYAGRPVLGIDYAETPLADRPYRITTPIAWSPARNTLATLMRDEASGATTLVVASVGESAPSAGEAHFKAPVQLARIAVPVRDAAAPLHLEWTRAGNLLISQEPDASRSLREAWSFDPLSRRLQPIPAAELDAADTAVAEIAEAKAGMSGALARQGISPKGADVWVAGSLAARRAE